MTKEKKWYSPISMDLGKHVISRFFRPQTFAEVVGQQSIVTTLKNALCQERVAQAYLFAGTRGTGKTTLARLFAKAINCNFRASGSAEPCNKCESCLSIADSKAFEVVEIDGASHRGIDDIRQINDLVLFTPPPGKSKIILIDEVHMLTKEAFNALLKTLEEPPLHVCFLFATTEPQKVPLTILSRCQRFHLRPLKTEEILNKLQQISTTWEIAIEKEALELICLRADGSMRDAESFFQRLLYSQSGVIDRKAVEEALGLISLEWMNSLDKALLEKDRKKVLLLASELSHLPQEPIAILSMIADHYKKHLFAEKSPFEPARLAKIFERLMDMMILGSKMHLRHLHLDMLLLSLIEAASIPSLEEIGKLLLERYSQEPSIHLAIPSPQEQSTSSIAPPSLENRPPVANNFSTKASDANLMNFAAATLNGHLEI